MSDVSQWSPIDANNNATPPDGFPEGMPASTVNDASRAVMGGTRRQFENGGWFDWGHAATFVDANTFQVPGDLSAVYHVGRRIRVAQTATVYGTVKSATVAVNTDVALVLDSGAIANESMAVSTGPELLAVGGDGFKVGDCKFQSYSQLEPGWQEASGQALDKAEFPELDAKYAADGYPWGSDTLTFNVINLNGRAPIGRGQGNTAEGGGLGTTYTLGQEVGAETHTLVVAELPTNNKTVRDPTQNQPVTSGGTNAADNLNRVENFGGSDQPHNNVSPAVAAVWVIKVLP